VTGVVHVLSGVQLVTGVIGDGKWQV